MIFMLPLFAEMITYLADDHFIKITNTDDFPQLSEETRDILKNYGLPGKEGITQDIVTTGQLSWYKPHLVEIGYLKYKDLGPRYCIDLENNERVVYIKENGEISPVNSSLRKFLECKYAITWYYQTIEFPEKYGEFYENDNHIKYGKVFRELLDKVEPGIERFPYWEFQIIEKELGVN